MSSNVVAWRGRMAADHSARRDVCDGQLKVGLIMSTLFLHLSARSRLPHHLTGWKWTVPSRSNTSASLHSCTQIQGFTINVQKRAWRWSCSGVMAPASQQGFSSPEAQSWCFLTPADVLLFSPRVCFKKKKKSSLIMEPWSGGSSLTRV